jgi:hypothetical protein
MKRRFRLVLIGCILLSGCSYVHTEKADLNAAPNGVRVFPSKFFLAADAQKNQSTIFYAPDMQKAYDIKPITIFAKNDFQVDVEEGQIKSLKSNQDTTGFLTFFQSIAGSALKAAGLPVSSQNIEGTFGLPSGIYTLDDSGNLARMQVR